MTHQEALEILPLYAVGGLDAESVDALERHLNEPCRICPKELHEWRELVGLLPLGLTPPGPDMIKERLKARIQQDGEPQATPAQSRVEPPIKRRRWIAIPLAAAALMLLVFGGLRYYAAQQRGSQQAVSTEARQTLLAQEREKLAGRETELLQLRTQVQEQQTRLQEQQTRLQDQQTRLQQQETAIAEQAQKVAELEGALAEQHQLVSTREQELTKVQAAITQERAAIKDEMATLKVALSRQHEALSRSEQQQRSPSASGRQRGVIEVLSTPDVRVGALQSIKQEAGIHGHVVWNEHRKLWLFYAFGLPKPPATKEYQVWFITEKAGPVSAGLFTPDQAGTGIVLASSPTTALGNVSAVAVTLEPAGGLPKPSGEMYLRGTL